MEAWEEMSLFLELISAHLCMLIIKIKIYSFLVKDQHKDLIITLTAEAKYPINFTQPNKRFVLSLHYNEINNFLFVNATKIYQFKEKKL